MKLAKVRIATDKCFEYGFNEGKKEANKDKQAIDVLDSEEVQKRIFEIVGEVLSL